jgi:hypothetical protein
MSRGLMVAKMRIDGSAQHFLMNSVIGFFLLRAENQSNSQAYIFIVTAG